MVPKGSEQARAAAHPMEGQSADERHETHATRSLQLNPLNTKRHDMQQLRPCTR
jgi:hypothetical protein